MPALTANKLTGRLPIGDLFVQVFDVSGMSNTAGDEWIQTEFSTVVGVLGIGQTGSSPSTTAPTFHPNKLGSAGATQGGVLGVRGTFLGGNESFHIGILGR